MMGRNKPMRRGQGAAPQVTPQQARMLFAKMSPEQKRKFAQMRNAMASRMGRR